MSDAKTIFCDAIEIEAPQDRDAYINRSCRSDPELRRQVDNLIHHHFQADSFLEPVLGTIVPAPMPPVM